MFPRKSPLPISLDFVLLQARVGRLVKWNLAVRMLYCLVDFIKVYDARVNLGAVLKVKYRVYDTTVFLRRGISAGQIES